MPIIKIKNVNLVLDTPQTYITSDTAAATTVLNVKNTTGFQTSSVVILGDLGNQGSEIRSLNGAPGQITMTTLVSTLYPHSASTPIRVIQYDQVEFSSATTVAGVKTAITTTALWADNESTNYIDKSGTTGYYFARFKNSVLGTFSSYSSPIPVAGYSILSARTVIDKALSEINKQTSDVLSDEYAFQQIDNFQEEVLKEQKRWSFMQSFNASQGQVLTGQWRVAAPTDLDDQFTNRGVYNARIATTSDLFFVDKEKWDEITYGVAWTTLASNVTVGATSILLTNSSDFNDSGTVMIGGNSYSYTANNRNTNTLTIPASTTTNTAGQDAFFGATMGTPLYWTIFDNYIYWYPIIDSTLNQRNFYLDYYKTQTQIVADSDQLVIPDSTCCQYYLQWKFLKKLNNGVDNEGSTACMNQYIARREKLKQKNSLGRTFRLKPLLNSLNENQSFGKDPRSVRDGNFSGTDF